MNDTTPAANDAPLEGAAFDAWVDETMSNLVDTDVRLIDLEDDVPESRMIPFGSTDCPCCTSPIGMRLVPSEDGARELRWKATWAVSHIAGRHWVCAECAQIIAEGNGWVVVDAAGVARISTSHLLDAVDEEPAVWTIRLVVPKAEGPATGSQDRDETGECIHCGWIECVCRDEDGELIDP